MKTNIIHSIVVCLAAFALPFMVACSSQEESLSENGAEVTLFLDIATFDATRAGTATLPDNEKMHSVRVIILHADGTVEHNRFYPLDGAQEQKYIFLKVRPNEKKRIYLFANEESVSNVEGVAHENTTLSAFFEGYGGGSTGFADAVDNLYFAPDYTGGNNIPMSSMYEMDIPEEGIVEETFYVVRVATKFIVNFENWRGDDVCVEKFTIASHADKNFLMAHVDDSEQNKQLFNGKTWISWLKEVSDASSENDGYVTTEAAGWLKDYRLPAQADRQQVYTFASSVNVARADFDEGNLDDVRPGKASEVFYLPESMSLKAGAADGEQEYTLTLNINGSSEPFVFKLPNLKALFRNTNVVVNITMYKSLEIVVDVIPFTSVELKPDFGLAREDFTGYIVGKDAQGRPCWYDGAAGPYYLGPKDSHGDFVIINGNEYLLVYEDYERTAAKLHHVFEKAPRKKYLLTPQGITGYKIVKDHTGSDMYINDQQQNVWLDSDFMLKCFRTLNEWDRLDWNKAYWWEWPGIYPKYWFDILGNRYPWSAGDTEDKRREKIGEWAQYLE